MRALVFDAGPIINFATNNLLWFLEEIKKRFNGDFYIPKSVKEELINKPLRTRRFKFEAMQIAEIFVKGVLKAYEEDTHDEALKLLDAANKIFFVKKQPLRLVHFGEIEALVIAGKLNADALVIDERTTRLILEEPEALVRIMERRLHKKVKLNNDNLRFFRKLVPKVNMIRSFELVTIGYELGMFNRFLSAGEKKLVPDAEKQLLLALLWGVKLNGCAVTEQELTKVVQHEISSRKRKVL